MTRKLTLAALALACVGPLLPVDALAAGALPGDGSGAHGLAVGLTALGALSALIAISLWRPLLVAAVTFVLCIGYAFAAEVVSATPATAVIVPWGDWVVAIGQGLTAILLPILVGVVTSAVYRVAPWARLVLTQARIEQMTKAVTDYALNSVAGAAKGQVLTVPVGSAVITKAVQRAVDVAPAKVVAAAGGPAGVAELVFRTLHLEDKANAANTLAPAQAAIPAK
ncbi:hypothetical protein [Methylobacterium segetis]|uniref:hypothetical protein n=1 Tax=Methylobacterium segetis TaxID=2488750 RepID=UPI001049DA33|nr:hypothetical protein [Methylobacterium segetis]